MKGETVTNEWKGLKVDKKIVIYRNDKREETR